MPINARGPKIKDISGQRFGRLVALKCTGNKNPSGHYLWACVCNCGKACEVSGNWARSGVTRSCGCLQKEMRVAQGKKNKTHGMKNSDEYRSWLCMKNRCTNKKSDNYQYYGAKGIKIFDLWLKSFEKFFEYIGPCPSSEHTLERIDTKGNYEPGNVKWGTSEEQANNRTDSVKITAFGETLTVAQWSRKLNIPPSLVYGRIKRGWDGEKSLTTPIR